MIKILAAPVMLALMAFNMCEGQPVPTDYTNCVATYGYQNCQLNVVMDPNLPGDWAGRCIDTYAGIPYSQLLEDGSYRFWCLDVGKH